MCQKIRRVVQAAIARKQRKINMNRWYLFYCWLVIAIHLNLSCQRLDRAPKSEPKLLHSSLNINIQVDSLPKLEKIMSLCPRIYAEPTYRSPKPIYHREKLKSGTVRQFFGSLFMYLFAAGSLASIGPIASTFTMVLFLPHTVFAFFLSLIIIGLVSATKLTVAPTASTALQFCQVEPIKHFCQKNFLSCMSSPLTLIHALLMIAGDVEQNPGPDGKQQKAAEAQDDNMDQHQVGRSTTGAVAGHTLAQQESVTDDQPQERSQLLVSSIRSPHTEGAMEKLFTFPSQAGVEAAIINGQECNSGGIGPHNSITQSPIVTTDCESRQPTEHLGHEQALPIHIGNTIVLRSASGSAQPKHQKTKHKRSKSYEEYRRYVEKLQAEVYDLQKARLDPEMDPNEFFKLLGVANTLYRLGENCPICPVCRLEKDPKHDQIDSHVIPKSILKRYREIHGGKESDYMFDFSRVEPLSSKGLTYRLLCKKCDNKLSVHESKLANLYKYISGKPNTVAFTSKNDIGWLHFILLNILFRGILTCVDITNVDIELFMSLWKYCKDNSQPNVHNLPDFYLFLLPNKPFNRELTDFMYAFETLLRMPRCTELIKQTEGTFFYCKFDIFHLVVPACEDSKRYFKTFNNCLNSETKTLQWSTLPKAEKRQNTSFKSFEFIYPQEELTNHFPEVLLRWCCSLYGKYIPRVFNQPKCKPGKSPLIKGFCLVYLERFHFSTSYEDTQYPGFETNTRMNISLILSQQSLQATAFKQGTEHEQLDDGIFDGKFDDKESLQSARSHSPLRILGDLRIKLSASETQLKEVEDSLGARTKELGDTRQELGETRVELGKEKVRRTRSEKELHKIHESFICRKSSRCAELRRLISNIHGCTNKHSLSTEVSCIIKEIKDMQEVAKTASWGQDYCSKYKGLLREYKQLETWLHRPNSVSPIFRHHSHS